ncbi:MAG: hypothetical protein QOI76_975 [Frankiales bacterium]|jgi:hypothetical protein|nr:hypothetical protein [Frankiales bacterium]
MYLNSYVRPRNLVAGGTAIAVATAVWLVPDGHAGAASQAGLATRTSAVVPAAAKAAAPDPNLYPFGMPSGGPIVKVPSPPGAPTLSPTIATKSTTRIYGADSFEEAISVTQHIWPAALPENSPNLVPDRPRAVTLLTPDDPLTAITATPIIHFPDDAPVLYVTKTGIPANTLNEIKRLGPSGINRFNNVDAFLVGAAANSAVESQLKAIGIKFVTVTAGTIPDLANKVDKLYGSIVNPDGGVPVMDNGMADVVIGSTDGTAYQYLLPATHWVSHMPTGLFWVTKNSVPQATIDALKRRNGQARIYVFGGPGQISSAVATKLAQYGSVVRVTNDDFVAYNTPPVDTPEATAVTFSKMWDSAGEMGWKITGPGHGFTLVNINDWQAAVASSPLSHLGFHAPLLFTDSATTLPTLVDAYFKSVEPTFLTSPADGPYNMTFAIGSWAKISWAEQLAVEYDSEMGNRRDAALNTGGRYGDSAP